MNSWKTIDDRGSITPFMAIVVGLFAWVFIATYNSYLSTAQAQRNKVYLENASNDLLAGFHSELLIDYGLLAYNKESASEMVTASIQTNRTENVGSLYLKENEVVDAEKIHYMSSKGLRDKASLATVCIQVAEIHLPVSVIEEIATIYDWEEKMRQQAKEYDKVNAVFSKLQDLQEDIRTYQQHVEEINTLRGYDVNWYENSESGRVAYMVGRLVEDHKKALENIQQFKVHLRQAKDLYMDVADDIASPQMKNMLTSLSFSLSTYEDYIGENSLTEVVFYLEDNMDMLEDIIEEREYEDLGDLYQSFDYEEEKTDSGWLRFLNEMKTSLGHGYNRGQVSKTLWVDSLGGTASINIDLPQQILLNEYFLGVLTQGVTCQVRNFDFLSKNSRESTFDNGEVEYLITGSTNSQWAIQMRLFGLRMAGNMAYLMTDKEKLSLAKTVGSFIGGWIPGGEIVATGMVLGGWSGLESVHDVGRLMEGHGVAFYKSDTTWHYDIDLDNKALQPKEIPTSPSKSDQSLSYYNDYMRILLFFTPTETKIGRFQEVLCENVFDGAAETMAAMTFSHELMWEKIQLEAGYYEKK